MHLNNGMQGKNIVSSPKWAIIPCIYPLGSSSKQDEEQETFKPSDDILHFAH